MILLSYWDTIWPNNNTVGVQYTLPVTLPVFPQNQLVTTGDKSQTGQTEGANMGPSNSGGQWDHSEGCPQ